MISNFLMILRWVGVEGERFVKLNSQPFDPKHKALTIRFIRENQSDMCTQEAPYQFEINNNH